MGASNRKTGRMPCLTCADPVWLKTTATGKLAFRCDGCGSSGFAETGDRAHGIWSKRMTPYADPDAPPHDPATTAKPTAKPTAEPAAPRAGSSVFSMGL